LLAVARVVAAGFSLRQSPRDGHVHGKPPQAEAYGYKSLTPESALAESSMLDGPSVVAALEDCGVSHAVWIPDSELGQWEPALAAASGLSLIRVCREGEAIAVAAGLLLGGKRPIVLIQCTGLFEAGDSLRNCVHDLRLPLFLIVGVRSWYAHQAGASADSCPVFTEPILRAWQIPFTVLERRHSAADLAVAYREAQAAGRAAAVLVAE
jgi:sulfopyruvate decarboxylase TPP-binding subunit